MYRCYLSLVLLSCALVGCAQLATVSLTTIPKERQHRIEAEVSKFIFFGFSFDNDFLDELEPKLAAQCPNGKVAGILTKHERRFYLLAHTERVIAKGYCLQQGVER
ncbi:MAG: hypothetical protein A2284_13390 [Deltaproteobacteria bacterium RIFOXYA12_FULL_61_11]|nr:MAG: hypothetical protein A2284_13390 [Deltaproteobacteria bacterium RIFOXYA12_FULL_61_11]